MSLLSYFFKTKRSNEEESSQSSFFLPEASDSGLGQQEYKKVVSNVIDLASPASPSSSKKPQERCKRNSYTHYSGETRVKIAKYAVENVNAKAVKYFEKEFPNLKESTVRNFKKKYYEKLSKVRREGKTEALSLPSKVRGRPPILMELDGKLIRFLKGIRGRGGVINIHVVRAVTQALIDCNTSLTHLANFDMSRSWVHSIYKRMGYKARAGTTSRPPVPFGLFSESRFEYLSNILETVEQYAIPPQLIFNADQTPCSYVSVGKMTMAKKGDKSIPMKGLTEKRNITLTFIVSFTGEFLLMQIIYGGKTDRSQPRGVKFPKGFNVTQNRRHWSNEEETIKFIKHIINPRVISIRKELGLPEDQSALLNNLLTKLNIKVVMVPANMTHFFQPLDLTVNGSAKNFMKKFVTWYANEVKKKIEEGVPIESVEIDLSLTRIKPTHALWLIELFNFLTSEEGKKTIPNGWKKAGVTNILMKTEILPPKDLLCKLDLICKLQFSVKITC